jgi:hypothetical protein
MSKASGGGCATCAGAAKETRVADTMWDHRLYETGRGGPMLAVPIGVKPPKDAIFVPQMLPSTEMHVPIYTPDGGV